MQYCYSSGSSRFSCCLFFIAEPVTPVIEPGVNEIVDISNGQERISLTFCWKVSVFLHFIIFQCIQLVSLLDILKCVNCLDTQSLIQKDFYSINKVQCCTIFSKLGIQSIPIQKVMTLSSFKALLQCLA